MKIKGLYTALVTPVVDNEIHTAAFGKLIDHVIDGGSDGLVVLGGTGEYGALSMGQRAAAITYCVEKCGGTLPVVVGILNPGLNDAIEMGRQSKELGADAVMLVTPYYVLADHKGLVNYHLKFMDAVDLPLILYNIPHRTMVNMQPETVAEIVDRSGGQVIGIKECAASISHVSRLISMVADRISVICGEEPLLCTTTTMGATAAILATSNVIPRFWKEMLTAIDNDEIGRAVQMHLDIQPFLNTVFSESNPGPLKAALKHAGIDCGDALPPLHAPEKAVAEKLAQEMQRIKKWWN